MKRSFTTRIVPSGSLVLPALLLATSSATADDFTDRRNRFHFGARAGINLDVEFKNTAAALPEFHGPATGGGIDRFYQDGSVQVDASGNAGGQTWFWSYQDASQIDGNNAGLALHGYSGSPYADASSSTDDPQWGAEFQYARVFGELAGAQWGLEFGFNWMDFGLDDTETLAGSLTRVTDTFALDGVIPPQAPYAGSYDGPGPTIADSPTRTLSSVPTTVTGRRELTGSLYGLRLGPMLDIPLGDWLSAQLSGGLAVGFFDGDLAYSETATAAGAPPWARSGSTSSSDWLLGAYARGQVTVRLTDRFGLYAAAEYQFLEDYEIETTGQRAEIDFGAGLFLSAGLNLRF